MRSRIDTAKPTRTPTSRAGARDRRGFGRKIGQALRPREVHHDRADAAERARDSATRRDQIGIDRGDQRLILQPGFQRLAAGAERARPHRAAVIVGIDERRHDEHRLGSRRRDGRNRV